MVQRVTYRRRLSYNTQSNKVRKVRTPGKILAIQDLRWWCNTLPSEDMDPEHLMTAVHVELESMVFLNWDLITTRDLQRKIKLCRDPMVVSFAEDVLNQELSGLFSWKKSRLSNVPNRLLRNDLFKLNNICKFLVKNRYWKVDILSKSLYRIKSKSKIFSYEYVKVIDIFIGLFNLRNKSCYYF